MGDTEKFEDFYANAERRIRELNKKRDDAMNETPQKIYAKIGELIGTLTLDGEEYPVKGLSDKTAQILHRTVCPNCGAPHSPWEAQCEYCGGTEKGGYKHPQDSWTVFTQREYRKKTSLDTRRKNYEKHDVSMQ